MPSVEVDGVGAFEVEDGKRLVLATEEDAGVDRRRSHQTLRGSITPPVIEDRGDDSWQRKGMKAWRR